MDPCLEEAMTGEMATPERWQRVVRSYILKGPAGKW